MNDITIDKTGWKKYRFDEMVQNISERVEPSQTDLDVYVGLEHIDPDSLHIKRHGHPSDVEGTKLRFYKGDIIFGRRRAYQRKTALATTDGICSAHAMVLRAKEDVIDPLFLPFLFHSKSFIDMAITISVGGLSPTINWKDIAKQEFLLPPKPEQKRLAALLWAADEMIEKEKGTELSISYYFKKYITEKYQSIAKSEVPLGDLCMTTPLYGANLPATDFDGCIRYIRITDINEYGDLKNDDIKSTDDIDIEKYKLTEGDILIARTATPGKSFLYNDKYGECVFAGYLIRFTLNTSLIHPKYVFYYTLSSIYWQWIKSTIKTGTVSNINAKEYSSLKIPFCSMQMQEEVIREIDKLFCYKKQLCKQLDFSQNIKNKMINKIF